MMKPETEKAIERCLKFKGGRSRPDKSFPFIIPLLRNLPREKHGILDIGCGRGSAGIIIDSEFGTNRFTMIGIDAYGWNGYFNSDMLRYYEKLIEKDILIDYMSGWDCRSKIILMIDVIEHIDRDSICDIVRDMRRNGATIIASIPNAPKHWQQDESKVLLNPYERHVYNWTTDEVIRDLGLDFIGENDGIGVFAYGI
jgi:2-polyprenyl-3-methyl-5-hydroxy-6-metoxy-1,4-benzoquinol methylase